MVHQGPVRTNPAITVISALPVIHGFDEISPEIRQIWLLSSRQQNMCDLIEIYFISEKEMIRKSQPMLFPNDAMLCYSDQRR